MNRSASRALLILICIAILSAYAISIFSGAGKLYETRTDDFIISFIASMWEDILLFLSVGVGVLVIQSLNKGPNSYKARMKSIFGGNVNYTDSLHNYIDTGFRDLLTYFEKIVIEITFVEVSDDRNHLKIQFVRRIIAGNLSKDTKSRHKLEVNLDPEQCSKKGVPQVFDIESSQISSVKTEDPPEKKTIYKGKKLTEKVHEFCDEFEIDCGKYRWYKYAVETWEDISTDRKIYELQQKRYLKDVSVVLKNITNSAMELKLITNVGDTRIHLSKRTEKKIRPEIGDNESSALFTVEVSTIT